MATEQTTGTCSMNQAREEFIEALLRHVQSEIRGMDAEYIQDAIKILDARNHLFINIGHARTDEGEDVYALRDLCHLDDSMEITADKNRIEGVARNYFG